jgi:CheY-like chemotaxis protein
VSPGPNVRLTVSDTGCGMSPEVKAHLFEPFFTTKGAGKGTGLGLSTVYGIVNQSRGHIAVYSEPGVGTTFKIHLPRVTGLGEHIAQTAPDDQALPRGAETILVVEDNDLVRNVTRQTLRKCGYNVLVATSGEEALRLAGEYADTVQLVLTDVVMPEMSGRRLVERLAPILPGVRVLFMSGYTDDAILRHGGLTAGTAILEKPFTAAVLARRVREALDGPAPNDTVGARGRGAQ